MPSVTNLLSANIFRRDQIWFTQKDRYGVTELYSLAEYKVRNDASFGKQLNDISNYNEAQILAGDDGWNPVENGNVLLQNLKR